MNEVNRFNPVDEHLYVGSEETIVESIKSLLVDKESKSDGA